VAQAVKSTTPTQYRLTPEFFAQRRQILAQRKAYCLDVLKQMQVIDEAIDRLNADEKLAAEVAERYPEADIAAQMPKKRAKMSEKAHAAIRGRPVPSGRTWTVAEEAEILAGDPANDENLAQQLDRKPGSIAKQRRKILRARPPEAQPESAAEEAWVSKMYEGIDTEHHPERTMAVEPALDVDATTGCADDQSGLGEAIAALASGEPVGSEKPENYEPSVPTHTDTDYGPCPTDPVRVTKPAPAGSERRVPRPLPPQPGRTVEGLVDDGPGRPRHYYDPNSFATREPR
jgi:hypothetical protein